MVDQMAMNNYSNLNTWIQKLNRIVSFMLYVDEFSYFIFKLEAKLTCHVNVADGNLWELGINKDAPFYLKSCIKINILHIVLFHFDIKH